MSSILAAVALWWRMVSMPDVNPRDATVAWAAAELEATPRVDAATVASLMWAESRFRLDARPACGVMQVYPQDLDMPAATCALWRRSVDAGVAAGVLEIETMLRDRRVRSLRDALLYRACGNAAFRGACGKGWWVDAALSRASALRAGSAAS